MPDAFVSGTFSRTRNAAHSRGGGGARRAGGHMQSQGGVHGGGMRAAGSEAGKTKD
jgi:hypothetical protein